MAVAGVICEYDPFHLGHARQLAGIRARLGPDTAVVCLMSGDYVQRGVPAVFDKYARAEAAALCGADLVLELPLTCAVSSAEGFASGGVEVLTRLGAVDTLCFGSESGDAAALQGLAKLLLSPALGPALREALRDGRPFAAARAEAVRALGGDASLLERPNDILAVEYCKALAQQGSPMKPLALLRTGDDRSAAPDPQSPSATAVRALLSSGGDWEPLVPAPAAEVFRAAVRHSMQAGERAVLARLRALPDEAFDELPFGSEGLSNRLRRAVREEAAVEDIIWAVKSKRYALARVRRMVLCAYLGLTAADLARTPPYVRVLALTERGRPVLRKARDEGTIPLIHAGDRPPDPAYGALERRAEALFGLFSEGPLPRTEAPARVFRPGP